MAGRSPARFLAPLALVAFAVALFAVVSAGTGDDATSTPNRAAERSAAPSKSRGERKRTATGVRARRTYTVKPGDTPSTIAEKTGVPLADIERLNPDLDPQLLAPGDRIRLR